MAEVRKLKRSELKTFLDTAKVKEGELTGFDWEIFGLGITAQEISYNPEVEEEQYVHEDSPRSLLETYNVTIDTEQTAYAGEPVFEFVNELRRNRATGTDAETSILIVDAFEGEGNSFPAELQRVVIAVESYGGEAGGRLPINYSVNGVGDSIAGTVSITDGKAEFTPSTQSFVKPIPAKKE